MQWLTWSVAILVAGAAGGCATLKDRTARLVGTCGCVFGCAAGVYGAALCLLERRNESRLETWNVPFASLNLGIDGIGACFLIPALVVGALAGLSTLRQIAGEYAANRPREHWLYYNLMLAAVVLLTLARNGVLFLFAWCLIAVTAFLLAENTQLDPRARGGWTALATNRFGAACLFALFALLGSDSGKLDFNAVAVSGPAASAAAVLAFAGFGCAVGVFPFHSRYAAQYPQAPSHVGAALSGTVGVMAFYGLARTLDILANGSPPPLWWGCLLTAAGLATAVAGALGAFRAMDLSLVLALSSSAVFGLVAAGFGFGLIGSAVGDPLLALLGFTGAVFHLANHAVAKGLLFLASGSVYARSGTRRLDRLGGLAKVLPATSFFFLLGGLGAAALPPLAGFVGIFLLLAAAVGGAASPGATAFTVAVLLPAAAIATAAWAMTAAAFARAFGKVFLGAREPDTSYPAGKERTGKLVPQTALAAVLLCLIAASPRLLGLVRPTGEKLLLGWMASKDIARMADVWRALGPESYFLAAVLGTGVIALCLVAAWALRKMLVMGKGAKKPPPARGKKKRRKP